VSTLPYQKRYRTPRTSDEAKAILAETLEDIVERIEAKIAAGLIVPLPKREDAPQAIAPAKRTRKKQPAA
jgi:hypothetical protein